MTDERSSWLVSTEWLASHLNDPDLVVVDGSWHLPTSGRNGHAEYLAAHVPGAVFFDIDKISDTSSGLPHMLPKSGAFGAAVGALGIGDGMTIVVYDGSGLFSAPRVWWTLRAFGAKNVRILDGGFPMWQAEGRPVVAGSASPALRTFTAMLDSAVVANIEEVARKLEDGTAQVVDARPADRFRGEAPEPRPGVRPGHIPGSRNLPFPEVVANGKLATPETIRSAFNAAGVDPARPTITSCGSGVSAAILWLALESINQPPVAIYDGSWAEWGASDMPLAIGPA
ncbi:3-mercaptopyruvate sulfurtransferase [Starkeya sp. ORNL1]|uniref:3-mercaptopyruvate sulfurtransferase n=1 Tax=Starkeya sp. ORNL1 TaxID=2709380 RepID=UPI00146296A5|nr:3-mercaptopyruvate sulfurtransferase [Starkeya sp. ORNL1]QJP13111.1 3-mercaptopyruvate sulfurtransferase [Starkeya sp. ORNL1]